MPTKKKSSPSKAAEEKESVKETKSKLRIKLRAYDYKVIDNSTKQIVETALRYGAEI